jgi:hypothetical protein
VFFLAVRTDGIKWDEGNAIILSDIFKGMSLLSLEND